MNPLQLTKVDKASMILGTAGLGLSIFDALKAKGIDTSQFPELVKGTLTDSRAYVEKVDPTIKVVDSPKTLADFVDKELGDRNRIVRAEAKRLLGKAIEKGNNAFAFPGKGNHDYVISSPKANPVVLDHEIGHIKDFKTMRGGGSLDHMKKQDRSILRGLGRMFSKRIFEKDIVQREERAWANVDSEDKKKIEQAALDTYRKGFHYTRGKFVGGLGGSAVGSVLGMQLGRRLGRPIAGSAIGSAVGMGLGMLPSYLSKTEPA